MLTAIRELAEEAEAGGGLGSVVARGDDCVLRTRELLPVLTEAGVVDAGAAGLVEIVRGIAGVIAGEPLREAVFEQAAPRVEPVHQDLSEFRYCTAFVIEGDHLDADELERELESLGDSLLVVGDPAALKVHVHTDDPGRALSLGVARGTIANVEIANMHAQTLDRERRLLKVVPEPGAIPCALVVVASGAGVGRLFESLGAHVVDGGRTMNPSTSELIAAIDASGAHEAILLPNDANVVLAAEHAAAGSRVPHDRSWRSFLAPAGYSSLAGGLIAFDAGRLSSREQAAAMELAAADVGTGAVTVASRDVQLNAGVRDPKGLLASVSPQLARRRLPAATSFDEVALGQVVGAAARATARQFSTFLNGDQSEPLDGLLDELAASHPELELEVHEGGQPHYALLIGAE